MRAAGFVQDVAKPDSMNTYFISVLTYIIAFSLFGPKTFVDEFIMVETNKIIEGPDLDIGKLLWFIVIWMLMTKTLAKIGRVVLAKTLYIFSVVDKFASTSLCLAIVLKLSAML